MLGSLGPKPAYSPVRPRRITEPQEVHAPWKEASQGQALYVSGFRESPARNRPLIQAFPALREPRRSKALHPRGSQEEETYPKTPEADLVKRRGIRPLLVGLVGPSP